jgi:hypothetical protein
MKIEDLNNRYVHATLSLNTFKDLDTPTNADRIEKFVASLGSRKLFILFFGNSYCPHFRMALAFKNM